MDLTKDKIFDLIIVGAGMMGSAAARHASLIPNTSVCLVGPPEPKIRKGHNIFGCWFDEGRICRRVSSRHTWSNLATHSISRFRDLEADTGIPFYTESGYMDITPSEVEFHEMMEISHKAGLAAKNISQTWKEKFPYFNIPSNNFVLLEEKNAGHISPRELVNAQQTSAHLHGAHIIRDIVETIKPSQEDNKKVKWLVVTESGAELRGERVLVAAGGFAGLKRLFASVAPGRQPALQLRTQTIAFLKLKDEEAQRLSTMPTMVTEFTHGKLDGTYILPPIKYPDGNYYIKLGHGRAYEEVRSTLEEVSAWYVQQTGIQECVDQLAAYMQHLIPDLKVEAVSGDGCLTSHSPNSEPYIDVISPGFGVALGGNGYAAKASDEIGRLAARLLLCDEWDTDIPKERVNIIWDHKETSKL